MRISKSPQKTLLLLFSISLLLNLFFYFAFGYSALEEWAENVFSSAQATSEDNGPFYATPYYRNRIALFSCFSQSNGDIIFIGDSLTEHCEWAEMFNNPNIKNRGISGDSTAGVIARIDDTCRGQPETVFIMIGINDLVAEVPSDRIIINYEKIIEQVFNTSPNTRVVIQSVLPVDQSVLDSGKIIDLNGDLCELATELDVVFVDLFSLFADSNNQIKQEYSLDGIHLTPEGYQLWCDSIITEID